MNCPHYNALWWADLWLFFFHPPQQNIKRTKCHRGLLFYCPNDRIIDIHRLNQSSSFFVMFFSCHMDIINYYLFRFLSWSKIYQIEKKKTWKNYKLVLMHTYLHFVINSNFPFWYIGETQTFSYAITIVGKEDISLSNRCFSSNSMACATLPIIVKLYLHKPLKWKGYLVFQPLYLVKLRQIFKISWNQARHIHPKDIVNIINKF